MRKYVYKGKEYNTVYDLATSEGIAMPRSPSDKLLKALGVTIVEESSEEKAARDLEQAKRVKRVEIERRFTDFRNNAGRIRVPEGFDIDATSTSLQDVQGLLDCYDNNRDAIITFRDADNVMHDITYDTLLEWKRAINVSGVKLYALKWQFQEAVEKATTVEEVAAITVDYSAVAHTAFDGV